MTWFDAMALQDGKWRVPSKMEMESLYEPRPNHPMIDTQVFPDAPLNQQEYYWTSTKLNSYLENANRACAEVVGFNGDGGAYSPFGGYPGIFHMPVMLVGNGAPSSFPPLSTAPTGEKTTSDGRWILRGGEAFDRTTGLTWQRCSVGLTYAGQLGCQGTPREYTFAEALKLEGGEWRLPTGKELETLFYHGPVPAGMPLLDPNVFTDIDSNHAVYWSSTPYVKDCANCRGPFCEGNCEYDASGNRVSRFVFCANYKIGWNCMTCLKTQSKMARLVRSTR